MSNRIAVFDDGVVQQLSTPDVLYEKPENSFVAQFIGENNRFSGIVKKIEGNKCEVELQNGELVKALKINVNQVGDKSQLSVRPERVNINQNESAENSFKGSVRELIYLGDHIRVRLNVCNNEEFIVKIPNEGDNIDVSWQSEDIRALDHK